MTDGKPVDGNYNYQMMQYENWEEDYVLFELMACDEGHVVLADQQDPHDDATNVVEIIVGGWGNNRVVFR